MEKDVLKPTTPQKIEKKGLGRGLAALLGDEDLPFVSTNPHQSAKPATQAAAPTSSIQETMVQEPAKVDTDEVETEYKVRRLPIEQVHPNAEQPRQHFSDAKLQELAESICEQGLIQPIIVRREDDQSYQIVAGERRWRACKMLGMSEIPAIIREQIEQVDKNDLASVIENIQRVDLNAIELADAYSKILKAYQFTQEELAKKLGVSRVSVANTIRLQKLPAQVKEYLVQGKLTEGHARALLTLENEADILALADDATSQSLSVRDVEARVRAKIQGPSAVPVAAKTNEASAAAMAQQEHAQKTPEILSAEEELRGLFGTKVLIRGNTKGGMIELFYANEDSLHRILHQLRSVPK